MKISYYILGELDKTYYWDKKKNKVDYHYVIYNRDHSLFAKSVEHNPTGRWKTVRNKLSGVTDLYLEFERVVSFGEKHYYKEEKIKNTTRVPVKRTLMETITRTPITYNDKVEWVSVQVPVFLRDVKEKLWIYEDDIETIEIAEDSDYEITVVECNNENKI